MSFYFSKEFTATQNGSTLRDARCEKCGCAYHYELARTGFGAASSPYMLNNAGAAARAQRRAVNNLRKRLATDAEAVPCPQCGWVQADMVRWLQRDYLRRLSKWTIAFAVVAMVALFIWWYMIYLDRGSDAREMQEVYTWAVLVVGVACALLGVRRMLASMQDPNRHFPARSRVRPGTPPALLRVEADEPARYVPAREEELTVMVGRWAEVQMQRAVLPDACCLCLGGADCVFSVPYRLSSPLLEVPLCRGCRRDVLWRWWAWVAITLVLAAGMGWGAAALGETDDFGRAMLGTIVFIFAAAILAAVVPEWRVRPYRIRTIDADRGVARVWSSNARYTELFAERYLRGTTHEVAPPSAAPPETDVGVKS